MDLNNRKLAVLSLIAQGYLRSGEPIGSKAIVSELEGSVSSATIRNDMAELERRGLVFQPHTSAGRIPTAAGLRLYTQELMPRRKLSKQSRENIDALLSKSGSVEEAISLATSALAQCSDCVSFSTAPTGSSVYLKQIDFIRAGRQTMIFVALTSTGIIKSVFVQLDSEITEDAIYCLAKAAERKLSGVALCDITPPLIQTMAAEMLEYSLLFSPFFTALYDTAQKLLTPEVLIKGENNLFNLGTSALNAAKALSFLRSDSFTDTLTQQNDKVSILIPEGENFTATALIYSGYKFSDDLFGSIGILGPYRLDYAAVIPMIEYFSSSLENMIKNSRIDK